MKDVIMFMTSWCPHCKRAIGYINQLREENPSYKDVEIVMVDEDKDRKYASKFDYFFVPTFYVGGEKVHEGVTSLETVRKVFEKALN